MMSRPTIRSLASELGLSPATVSLALRGDPRIGKETTERVRALAVAKGYYADPVVAEGLSRARRRTFYRETVVWLLDRKPEEQPWVTKLFSAAVERGETLGYRIEFCPVDFEDETSLKHQARVWRARGVRGALIGPLMKSAENPLLPWSEFSWVAIGQSLTSPALHRVGRDYDKDIDLALARLRAEGRLRPGFVDTVKVNHLMRLPLLRAALVYYHGRTPGFPEAYFTADRERPEEFARWLERNEPDSLVMGMGFSGWAEPLHRLCAHLPQVELSPPLYPVPGQERFVPDYASMGLSAMSLLHRLLSEDEKGIPAHEQTVLVSSGWGTE